MAAKHVLFTTRLAILVTFAGLLMMAVTLAFHSPTRVLPGSESTQAVSYLPVILHFLPSPSPIPSPTRPVQLVLITEVYYDPPGDEPEGEWIEVYNAGMTSTPLGSYKIGDAWQRGDAEGMLAFPTNAVLEPEQVVVVANQADQFVALYGFKPDFEMNDTDPQVRNMVRYTAWAGRSVELTNSGDEILILDGDNQPVDALSWGSSRAAFSPSAPRVTQGHSLERYPPYHDTNTAADWRDCAGPTPGTVDLTPPTPTPTLTPTVTQTPWPTLTATRTNTPTYGPSPLASRTPTGTLPPDASTPTSTEIPTRQRLLISEVLYDPAGTEPQGEWIELYNADTTAANLEYYKIGDEESPGGSEGMLRFPGGASLAPGQVVIIANRAEAFTARYGFLPDFEMAESDERVPNMIRYTSWAGGTVSLANSSPYDEVLLLDYEDMLVDALSWGSSDWAFDPPVPGVPEGSSVERYPANQDTDSSADWRRQEEPGPGNVDFTLPQRTITSSQTLSPSRTATATRTSRPSPNPSPSRTATVTRTLRPSPTPSPSRTATASPTSPPQIDLVINEVLADPPAQGGDANGDGRIDGWEDEFIELVNQSGGALDLSGWAVSDASGVRHVFPSGSIVPYPCAVLVFGGGTPAGDFGGSLVQTASEGWLTLRNFGDQILIFDPQGNRRASYTYGAEADEDQSITRSPDILGPEPLIKHSYSPGSAGRLFSPGTRVDGNEFGGCLQGRAWLSWSGNGSVFEQIVSIFR